MEKQFKNMGNEDERRAGKKLGLETGEMGRLKPSHYSIQYKSDIVLTKLNKNDITIHVAKKYQRRFNRNFNIVEIS